MELKKILYPVTKVTRFTIGRGCRNDGLFPFSFNSLKTVTNKNKMKKIILITGVILLFISGLGAQELVETDGLYYKNSQLYSGKYQTFFDNGQLKMEMKIVEGKKEGKIKIYFENGQLNETRSYKNNEMHGKWLMYNNHGIKTSVARYRNGKKHGKWKIWNDYGNILYQLQYNNGQKSGTWKNFNEKGEVINERNY